MMNKNSFKIEFILNISFKKSNFLFGKTKLFVSFVITKHQIYINIYMKERAKSFLVIKETQTKCLIFITGVLYRDI